MFLKGLQLYDKETPAQVFSCEICEIVKNIFNYRTPLVTASIITEKKSKFCLEWHWINVLRRSRIQDLVPTEIKEIWMSLCFQIQNEKVGPWKMSI